jgi:hypothetical protein
MRNIQYAFNAVELTALHHATDHKQVEIALGYLSSWNMSFPSVLIYIVDKDEIRAVYRDKEDDVRPGYVLAAVWHDDDKKFSFHS